MRAAQARILLLKLDFRRFVIRSLIWY